MSTEKPSKRFWIGLDIYLNMYFHPPGLAPFYIIPRKNILLESYHMNNSKEVNYKHAHSGIGKAPMPTK